MFIIIINMFAQKHSKTRVNRREKSSRTDKADKYCTNSRPSIHRTWYTKHPWGSHWMTWVIVCSKRLRAVNRPQY